MTKNDALPDPNPAPVTPLIGPPPPMQWNAYMQAFQTRLASARRAAYNTALRPSNDDLEAAMFMAMLQAYFDALPDGKDPIPVPEDFQPAPEQAHLTPGEPEIPPHAGADGEPPLPPRRRAKT